METRNLIPCVFLLFLATGNNIVQAATIISPPPSFAQKYCFPNTPIQPTVQGDFLMFRPLQGTPKMHRLFSSATAQVFFINEDNASVTIAFIDPDRKIGRCVKNSMTNQASIVRFAKVRNRNSLMICGGNTLWVYYFDYETTVAEKYDLPTTPILLDCGRMNMDGDAYVMLLGADGLYIGRFDQGQIIWSTIDTTHCIFSRLSQLHVVADWQNTIANKCQLVVDVDGDGIDEILLPDIDGIGIVSPGSAESIVSTYLPFPETLCHIMSTTFSRAPRMRAALPLLDRTVLPYRLAVVPNPSRAGSRMLRLLGKQHTFDIVRDSTGRWALSACAANYNAILTSNILGRSKELLDFAPHTHRLLVPRTPYEKTLTGTGGEWIIDVDGDGVPDTLRLKTSFSLMGPQCEVTYTRNEASTSTTCPQAGVSRKDVPLAIHAAASSIDWTAGRGESCGFVVDLNRDGALDLMFAQAELTPYEILSTVDSARLIPWHYQLWLFDKAEHKWTQASTFTFQQNVHPLRRIRACADSRLLSTSVMAVDYGDMDGNGCMDLVLTLSRKRILVYFLSQTTDGGITSIGQSELVLSEGIDGYVVTGASGKDLIVAWNNKENTLILFTGKVHP